MRFGQEFGGHLEVVQSVAGRPLRIRGEHLENRKIGASLDEKETLLFGHAARLSHLDAP
jgi:hypothetical protein